MTEKPIVQYRGDYTLNASGGVTLVPVDHTSDRVTNGKTAYTSRVLRVDPKSGEIETLNTIYIPERV